MMNIIKKAVSNRNVVLVALLAAASQTVLAGGFSSEATTMITNIRTGIGNAVLVQLEDDERLNGDETAALGVENNRVVYTTGWEK